MKNTNKLKTVGDCLSESKKGLVAIQYFTDEDYYVNALALLESVGLQLKKSIEIISSGVQTRKGAHAKALKDLLNQIEIERKIISSLSKKVNKRSWAGPFNSVEKNQINEIVIHFDDLHGQIQEKISKKEKPLLISSFILHRKMLFLCLGIFLLGGFALKSITYFKSGLIVEYYKDKDFSNIFRTEIDRRINYDWHKGPPKNGMSPNNFSIRWKGYLKVPKDGEYLFIVEMDDGARLWINDQELVSDWRPREARKIAKKTHLLRGKHKIRLDYYENRGFASVKLFWKTPDMTRPQIINYSYFEPD